MPGVMHLPGVETNGQCRTMPMPDGDRPNPAWPPLRPEQRSGDRLNLLIRPAKLVGRLGEYLCVLRDVSNGGCKVRLFHDLPERGAMVLELGNGDRYEVEQVWEREGHAGLRFSRPVPVEYLINESGPFRKRPVRLRLSVAGLLVSGRETWPVIVRDISQQGACLECDARLAVDQQVRLEIPALAPVIAKIRWRRGGALGLVFEQTFRLDELALVAAALQRPPAPPEAGASHCA